MSNIKIKLKKVNFIAIKVLFLKNNLDIEKLLVFISILWWKKCKYLHGYSYNDNKVKPLDIMLSKPSVYVKSYDGQTKQTYFLIEDNYLLQKCANTLFPKHFLFLHLIILGTTSCQVLEYFSTISSSLTLP